MTVRLRWGWWSLRWLPRVPTPMAGPLERSDDMEPREHGELGHAGTRTSTEVSFGDAGTSGTGVSSK
jgi:hypothetical protein